MEDWNFKQMTPFDCQMLSQSLQITKLLIPYLPPQTQRIMAIYVKYMEFQNTLSSFHTFRQKAHDAKDIIQELKPYMPPSACDSIDNIQNVMNMMELFQSFQQTEDGTSAFDPMSMINGMLTPEQEGMYEMFSSMFAPETNIDSSKGDE